MGKKVLRVRLSRSSKTGNSKGYAFVEFADEDVAKIVAETMQSYLLYGRLLQCHLVDPEKVWVAGRDDVQQRVFV